MTYEPLAYWTQRGEAYAAKFDHARYADQERLLFSILHGLEFDTVLEVGCGFGRVGSALRPAVYTGIDLSPTMLASARERMPDAEFVETSLDDYKPARKFDLVLAIEFLMHIPPTEMERAVRKLDRLASRYIVTCDWTTPLPRMKTADHNWLHPYDELFATGPFGRSRNVRAYPVGLQTIYVVDKT